MFSFSRAIIDVAGERIPVRHHKGPLSQMSAIAKEHQVRTCSAPSVFRTSLPAL